MQRVQNRYNKEGEIESILIFNERQIYYPGHPNAGKCGLIYESRFTAATALGRLLPTGSVVHHHRDGTLVICQDANYHNLLHLRMKAFDVTGDPHKRKCRFCKTYDSLENLKTLNVRHHQHHHHPYHHQRCKAEYEKRYYQVNLQTKSFSL